MLNLPVNLHCAIVLIFKFCYRWMLEASPWKWPLSSCGHKDQSIIYSFGITLPNLTPKLAFLTDVKPALLSALDTEYEKNPYEV